MNFREYATASVCIKCGKCGGTIVEAQKHIDKGWEKQEEESRELELAKKIYQENCGEI